MLVTIKGFHVSHIKPILQVIILTTTMLVSSLHGVVLDNTTKCPVTFYLVHTTIPNYNWVTRIISTHTGWNFFLRIRKLKVSAFFCCFSLYCAIQKGNQATVQNRAHMGAYRVVQTLYMASSSGIPLPISVHHPRIKIGWSICTMQNWNPLVNSQPLSILPPYS